MTCCDHLLGGHLSTVDVCFEMKSEITNLLGSIDNDIYDEVRPGSQINNLMCT
jgi:hypothetical protein